jgi:hypothetical protein
MTIKIDKKIVAYSIVKPDDTPITDPALAVQQMHENLERPDVLPARPTRSKHRYQTTPCTSRSTTSC